MRETVRPIKEYDGGTVPWHMEQAGRLLRPSEEIPASVVQTAYNLSRVGVKFKLSRNQKVLGCREAAHYRDRLGYIGIPLFDELKTISGFYIDSEGDTKELMVHLRGDQEVNIDAVAKEFPTVIRESFTAKETSSRFGRFNPFTDALVKKADNGAYLEIPRVTHIVDKGVLMQKAYPGTMMTNAGDRTWAVEFNPASLFGHIGPKIEADIALPPEKPRPFELGMDRPVQIITGNSFKSGTRLGELFLQKYDALSDPDHKGDVLKPTVSIASLPQQGSSMELDWREDAVWESLSALLRHTCSSDAFKPPFVVVADNTTPGLPIGEITEGEYGVPFISTAKATAILFKEMGVKKAALIGGRWVAQSEKYSSFFPALTQAEVEVERLDNGQIDRVDKLAYRVKQDGISERGMGGMFQELRTILGEIDSPVVIVGLTEISDLIAEKGGHKHLKPGTVYFDTMEILADAMAHKTLGIPFPSEQTLAYYRKKLTSVAA